MKKHRVAKIFMTVTVLGLAGVSAVFLNSCSSPEPTVKGNRVDQVQATQDSGQSGSSNSAHPLNHSADSNPLDAAKSPGPSKILDPKQMEESMKSIASAADNTVEDGWFFGQEARIMKSFYRKVTPEDKARFAMAYHNWLATKNQNLERDFESYIPYSQRADFARKWWTEQNPRFAKQENKYQVLWVHESIMDAGELWWRASERIAGDPVNSMTVLAHDEEQKMISKFMETTKSPGSLSDEIWKQSHSEKDSQHASK